VFVLVDPVTEEAALLARSVYQSECRPYHSELTVLDGGEILELSPSAPWGWTPTRRVHFQNCRFCGNDCIIGSRSSQHTMTTKSTAALKTRTLAMAQWIHSRIM